MLVSELRNCVSDIWGPVYVNGGWVIDIDCESVVIGGMVDALFGDEILEEIEYLDDNDYLIVEVL